VSALADMPAVLTVEEAAKLLRIGRSAAYEAARRGDIPVIRVGRLLRVPRHRLEALLGISESGSPAEETESAGDQKSSVEAARDKGYPHT
jgi:excisionase family DNA binding protein